jgi:DNA replication protein DnaC
MLRHPTLATLQTLTRPGMVQALSAQMERPASSARSCAARRGLRVDRERTERADRRLTTRLRHATLRQAACGADRDSRHPRGLDTSRMTRLAACQWLREPRHVLSTGSTGVGQTWVACALGHPAWREGFPVLSLRVPRLFQALPITTGAGRSPKRMTALARTALLLLEDWGRAALTEDKHRDVLALLEDRHERRSTLVTSQVPVDQWYEVIRFPTTSEYPTP